MHIKIKAWIVSIFYILPLYCYGEALPIRQAEVYAEAREYDRAQALFKKIAKENGLPWQKERIQYNLGTLLLEQEKYEEALEEYEKIPLLPGHFPLLSRALLTNLAILKLEEAKILLKQKDFTFDKASRAISLAREASNHIEQAKIVECEWELLVGRSVCQAQDDLKELHIAFKMELAKLAQKLSYLKITSTPIQEGIPFLLSGVNLAQSHLAFLELVKEPALKEKYQQLFGRDLESWLSLWDDQVEQMPDLKGAEEFFVSGTEFLKAGKWKDSQMAFLNAEAVLTDWMKTLWGDHPLREVLQKLLMIYQQALDQNPIQPSMLYQLASEQKRLKELMESTDQPLNQISQADLLLKTSTELAKSAKRPQALFYLLEARQEIRRVLRDHVIKDELTPEILLKGGIEEEVHALTLAHLLRQIPNEKDYVQHALEAQQKVLVFVSPFFKTVINQEKADWPLRCQCQPWKQVIPLFIKGQQAAEEAATLLIHEPESSWIVKKQEEAVKYWREALEQLHDPKEEKKEEDEETQPPPPQEPQESSSVQELLRQLQNMAQDDVKPKPEERPIQQGNRPW